MPTESLTEAITYATLKSSKQLLNGVIFILFALGTMKNPHKNELYSSMATKRRNTSEQNAIDT